MPGLNPTLYKEPYKPLDERVSPSYDYIFVPALEKDGKYITPTHVGKEGLNKKPGTVANTYLIWNVKEGGIEPEEIPASEAKAIINSTKPGILIRDYIKENYPNAVVLILTSTELEVLKAEGGLESIINKIVPEDVDAKQYVKDNYLGGKEEAKYKGEEEKAKYEREGEPGKERPKKEGKGKEGVTKGEEPLESEEEITEESGDVEGSSE